jgi:hypothetical protein
MVYRYVTKPKITNNILILIDILQPKFQIRETHTINHKNKKSKKIKNQTIPN